MEEEEYEIMKKKAEGLDTFLHDRLSEDDFKEFLRLFKELSDAISKTIGLISRDW